MKLKVQLKICHLGRTFPLFVFALLSGWLESWWMLDLAIWQKKSLLASRQHISSFLSKVAEILFNFWKNDQTQKIDKNKKPKKKKKYNKRYFLIKKWEYLHKKHLLLFSYSQFLKTISNYFLSGSMLFFFVFVYLLSSSCWTFLFSNGKQWLKQKKQCFTYGKSKKSINTIRIILFDRTMKKFFLLDY
jgi:hypothetical protein